MGFVGLRCTGMQGLNSGSAKSEMMNDSDARRESQRSIVMGVAPHVRFQYVVHISTYCKQ